MITLSISLVHLALPVVVWLSPSVRPSYNISFAADRTANDEHAGIQVCLIVSRTHGSAPIGIPAHEESISQPAEDLACLS